MRLYYSLLGIPAGGDRYEIIFGDYDRETVEDERDDVKAGGDYARLRIIASEDGQAGIDRAVTLLSEEHQSMKGLQQ